jgi:uncharacterized membrane protein
MVVGRRFWNLIWYAILLLGVAGLLPSIYWGRRTHWKNADEVIRAIGTITASVGMLILLNDWAGSVGQVLMVVALVLFVLAFVLGRRAEERGERPEHHDDEGEEEGGE